MDVTEPPSSTATEPNEQPAAETSPAPSAPAGTGSEIVVAYDSVTGKRLPYKSFRKKYLKMEQQFTKVMARSEELHKQKIAASRVFGRLAREKKRLLDVLLGLQESGKLNKELDMVGLESPPPETLALLGADAPRDELWNDEVKHLARMNDQMFDYSSDEDAEPVPRNPMSLIEWLRRNQPSVFTAEAAAVAAGIDSKRTVVDKTLGVQKGDASAADKTPTKKRKAPGDGASASAKPGRKKKSLAPQEDGESAGLDSPASAKAKRIKKEE